VKILVAVKQVPEVTESGVEIARDGRSIDTEDLSFDLGEWDACAVETAVRLKESHGGEVTAITVGDDEAEAGLRKALAMGADAAVRVDCDEPPSDPLVVARLIGAWAAEQGFDLVLGGVMAADDGYGAVLPALGGMLGWPHATMVIELELDASAARVTRELEEGLKERVELTLPVVLAAQTGLAEPRYVSIMGIRKVRKIPIACVEAAELGLSADPAIELLSLATPAAGRAVELIEGTPSGQAARVVELVGEVVG
jgi:electron transfer flavoprotein beta subunit